MQKQLRLHASLYISLFAISGGVFLFQIILTSILGFLYQHDFRLFGIMFGYVGFGLGGICAYWFTRKRIAIHQKTVFLVGILLTITGLLPFVLLQSVHSQVGSLSSDNIRQFAYVLVFVVSIVHCMLAGFVVSSLYTLTNRRTFQLYFYDLLGAGVISVLALIIVDRLGIFSAIPIIFLANSIGCVSLYLYVFEPKSIGKTVFLAGGAIFGFILVTLIPFQAVCSHGREIVKSKSNSFSLVQLAKYDRQELFTEFVVVYNCKLVTGGYITKDLENIKNVVQNFRNIPFSLDRPKNVLVLGSGAGYDIHMALLSGAEHVQAVEINPLIVEFANSFPESFGRSAYQERGVTTAIGDGVSYVAQSKNTYDLVLLAFAEGNFGSPLIANTIPSPSGMFTLEAIQGYLKVVRAQGTLAVIHSQPYSKIYLNTLVTLLRSRGQNPDSHIAVITTQYGSYPTELIVYKQSPITKKERDTLRELALLYKVRYEEKPIASLIPGGAYVLTNDRPFILQPNSLTRNNQKINNLSFDGVTFVGTTRFLPQLGLFLTASILILIVVIIAFSRQFTHVVKHVGFLIYCIGMSLGLAALEFVFMYKATFILGNPTYAHVLTLGCVLFGAALGSITLAGFAKRNVVGLGLLMIFLITMTTIGFYTITEAMVVLSPFAKTLLLIGMMLPVSYLSGAFFPYILEVVGNRHRTMVPWIWGIDAVAFVTSGLLLQFTVLAIGINASMFFGLAGYLLVVLSVKYMKS